MRFVPIVIRALGTVLKRLAKQFEDLEMKIRIGNDAGNTEKNPGVLMGLVVS